MKIRTDFVTNSSSSSFILGFKNVADVDKIIVNIPDYVDNKNKFSVNDLRETIVKDSKDSNNQRSKKKVFKDIMKYIKYNPDRFYEEQHITVDGKTIWQSELNYFEFINHPEYQDKVLKIQKDVIGEINKIMQNYDYFVEVCYADEDGSFFSLLEHDIVPELENCIFRFNNH